MPQGDTKVTSVTQEAYAKVRKWKNYSMQSLYFSAFLVFLNVVYTNIPKNWQVIDGRVVSCAIVVQIMALVAYHGFSLYASILHYDAGKKHFPDLIDNAFGTVLTTDHSENYYASAEMKVGAGKLAWNVTENCFFTKSIYGQMRWGIHRKSLIFGVGFLIAIVLNHSEWIVTIVRLTVPIVLIKQSIVFEYALREFQIQYDKAYIIMTRGGKNSNQLLSDAINILLHYETLKAWLNVPTDENIYNEMRDSLNRKFEKVSANFKIKKAP